MHGWARSVTLLFFFLRYHESMLFYCIFQGHDESFCRRWLCAAFFFFCSSPFLPFFLLACTFSRKKRLSNVSYSWAVCGISLVLALVVLVFLVFMVFLVLRVFVHMYQQNVLYTTNWDRYLGLGMPV